MPPRVLSVLIPLYNEEEFIGILLQRVLDAPLPDGMQRELIVVNDASRDTSAAVVERFVASHPDAPIRVYHHAVNQGKGAAIRTAIAAATGDFCIVQDADLEYDPREYARLLNPLLEGRADAVFGSRFLVSGERRVLYFWHSLGNQILTLLCNIASDVNLSDMETCYKLVRTSLLQSIPIRSNRFGIEPELTIKLARRKARIYEMPISYHGRTYEEGKKVGWKDAIEALWVILKVRASDDLYAEAGPQILSSLAHARRFNRWMADTIAPYVGERVLEISAGIGSLSRLLSPRRQYYAATDLDRENLFVLSGALRHPNVRVVRCGLDSSADIAQFRGVIDTVVCLNALEHVLDDAQAVRDLFDALPAGGRAVVLVPHDPGLYGKLDEVLGHRRYTREQLRRVMQQAGFRVDRMLDFNRASRPGWYITGKLLRRSKLNPWTLQAFDRGVGLWRKLDRHLPWQPLSIIAIGVKDC